MKNKILKITSLVICLTLVSSMFLTGCSKKKEEEEEITYELTAVTEDELEAGYFYAMTSEGFYKLPSGETNFTEKEAVAKETDSSRVVWFGEDDVLIPTVYADDKIVYCTNDSVPSSFTWERYEDDGYTIGICGLTPNEANRYNVEASTYTLKLDGSFLAAFESIDEGTVLVVDKVDGTSVSNANVAPGGTITGLTSGKAYTADVYVGSEYYEISCIADTHAFSSFELYETSAYSYAQSNYIILTIPNYLRSGYYYLNGIGMVRYANVSREEGIAGLNFNSAYYLGTDENGNVITADDEVDTTTNEVVTDNSNVYQTSFYVDCTNEKMVVSVSYSDVLTQINGIEINASDAILDSLNANPLSVSMTGPDDETYVFVASNQEENTLECTVDMPLSGEWTVTLKGFDLRTFTVSNTLTSGHSDTMIHSGSGKASMTYYLQNSMDTAIFEISWENTDRAATVQITTPDGTKISKELDESSVIDEGYGYVTFAVPNASYGNYTVEVDGDELGRVRVTTTDSVDYYDLDLSEAEIVEE